MSGDKIVNFKPKLDEKSEHWSRIARRAEMVRILARATREMRECGASPKDVAALLRTGAVDLERGDEPS